MVTREVATKEFAAFALHILSKVNGGKKKLGPTWQCFLVPDRLLQLQADKLP